MYLFLQRLLCTAVAAFLLNTSGFAGSDMCAAIGAKLSSVSARECGQYNFSGDTLTTHKRLLQVVDFQGRSDGVASMGRVLLIGGIHGDEFASVSIIYKWLKIIAAQEQRYFDWRVVPVANPDGLLSSPGQRQNANGVDLNRNFPTANWPEASHQYWLSRNKNPRRFPGNSAASEIETQWLIKQINDFKPDVIVSVHAPYSLLDFDGPPTAPTRLGSLQLNQLGIYPGSLGNYGSNCLGRQVVTLELESAGIMPTEIEIKRMWRDLVRWLVNNHMTNHNKPFMKKFALDPSCK